MGARRMLWVGTSTCATSLPLVHSKKPIFGRWLVQGKASVEYKDVDTMTDAAQRSPLDIHFFRLLLKKSEI